MDCICRKCKYFIEFASMFDGFGMCSNYKSPLVMFTVNYEDNCPYIEMEHEERDGEK